MKDTLREECDASEECLQNCCVNPYVAPLFFVVFVLVAQFVLVNVVVAVLMKHLEESHKQVKTIPVTGAPLYGGEQVKFEDLFLVQCFKLCAIETKEMAMKCIGRDINRKQKRQKADLTHKIETYFD